MAKFDWSRANEPSRDPARVISVSGEFSKPAQIKKAKKHKKATKSKPADAVENVGTPVLQAWRAGYAQQLSKQKEPRKPLVMERPEGKESQSLIEKIKVLAKRWHGHP